MYNSPKPEIFLFKLLVLINKSFPTYGNGVLPNTPKHASCTRVGGGGSVQFALTNTIQ